MNILEIIATAILVCFGLFVIGCIGHLLGYTKGFKDMREIFRTFMKNQWISVEDELPEKYLDDEKIELDFFVWGEGYGRAVMAHFNGKDFYFKCNDGSEGVMTGITHWQMPPNPPETKN